MDDPSSRSLTIQQAYELAAERLRAGDTNEAESLARQILDHHPAHPAALHLLEVLAESHYRSGNALAAAQKNEDAMAALRKSLRFRPEHADARFALANLLLTTGRLEEAVAEYRTLLGAHPEDAQTCNNLGNALLKLRRYEEAIEVHQRAIALRPAYAGALSNLGKALEDSGRIDQAIEAYRRAVQANADFAEAHFNLGNALRTKDDLDGAIAEYRRAIELRPNHGASHSNLGNALKDAGRLDEAIAFYRQGWDLGADARGAGNLLYSLYLNPEYDARRIYEEHARWNHRYAQALAPAANSFSNDRSADRKLRIGYVSPDFNSHPVGRFMLPILSHHDHSRFEIVCYADVRLGDDVTRELQTRADVWRETSDIGDADLAARIRDDRIDILVDLSLHTSRNRLLVFARKPAPVQANYLSYPGTSGLETMDYRITDPYLDPPSTNSGQAPGAEKFYSEDSIRLPRTYWCYDEPHVGAEVAPPPALTAGHVTFGCFNQFCKISRPAWDTWCGLLRAVPDSRMILLAPEGSSREFARQGARARGVDPVRLEFVGRVPLQAYLERHRLVDIALDPFPFTGGTTTCDALWMGVPVVTLRGDRAVARGGASILTNAGLSELIADTTNQYIQIASSLADDRPPLADLRANLRRRLLASSLMNARQFTWDLEQAYRSMWERWADG
jgi:predicted O-linked N-acetylglucosamine transferase (SPINDLY family)